MKTSAWKLLACVLPALLTAGLSAQTATPIYEYDVNQNGLDGGNPYGGLIQATDGNLYGTMIGGGANGFNAGGDIFRLTPSGQFSIIYSCAADGSDCNGPESLLELPDGNLYGVSAQGGGGYGNIFRLALDGSGFTNLFTFSNTSYGEYPNSGIIFTGSAIIGTTSGSGTAGDFDNSGTIWSFQPDFGVGFSVFQNIYGFASNSTVGYQPVNGVTAYNGLLYGSTQVGGGTSFNECGTFYSFDVNTHTPTVLHTFSCGTDGAYPNGQPKLYSDGSFYGTTFENGSGPDYGSVWKAGATSGFTTLYTFTGALTNADATVAFDTPGNIIFNSRKGGSNTYGALYAEKRSGGTPTVLYNFASQSPEGDTADSAPFFDNTGHMWTEELTGGGTVDGVVDEIGAIVEWNLSTETKAPISISVSPATVLPNATATVTWSANNAFSTDEQYCFATGITGWTGQQTGTYSGGVLSGSATIKPSTAGTYPLTITCGGTETAIANLTVSAGAVATTTTLTATPATVSSGQNVTITATVKKSSGTGTPTGKVTFYANGTSLAAVNVNGSGVASLTAPANYPNGTYGISAKYAGDASDAASTSNTVNVSIKDSSATALTITPSTVKAGSTVTLKATVSSTDGKTPTGSVSFSANGVSLFSANLSSGTISQSVSTSGYPAGKYTVTASYAGDSAHAPSSGTATVTLQ